MKFKRQAKPEFGRAFVPAGSGAAAGPAALPAAATASTGKAVASFYSSLVGTSGCGWVSRGTLQDGEPTSAVGAAPAAAPAAAPGGAIEVTHAGLGSAAARAELDAEAAALSYAQPAGPAARGGEAPGAAEAPQAAQQQQQQQQQQQHIRYGISRSNVGFQLLKKAGWREGTGLGAQEQGVAEPVEALAAGRSGLGYAPKPRGKPGQQAAGGAAGSGGAAGGGAAGGGAAQPKRPLPEDPLEKEDTDTKVKRVRQVMQAEADARASKAIERAMRRAFSDTTGEPTADSNPLLRRNHKLSATNPLL